MVKVSNLAVSPADHPNRIEAMQPLLASCVHRPADRADMNFGSKRFLNLVFSEGVADLYSMKNPGEFPSNKLAVKQLPSSREPHASLC